jgi:methyl-accepting chemotaxis protein
VTWFRNISLARKLYGLVGLLLAFLLVVGLMSISSLSSVDQKGSDIYVSNVLALDQLGAAKAAVTDEQRLLLQGITYPGDHAIQQATDNELAADQASFDKNVKAFTAAGMAPQERAGIATLRPALAAYLPFRDRVRSLTKAQNLVAATVVNKQADHQYDVINSSLDKLTSFNKAEAARAAKSISSTYGSSRTQIVVLLVLALLLGGGVAVLVVRQLSGSVKALMERMATIEKAFKGRLVPGLQALAGGDLTVKLEAGTAPASGFPKDELGRVMSQTENFRSALLECYEAYNMTAANLRSLIGEVTSTAGSVGAASQEMASTSEESGKATGEIAQAINEIAEGAERQARMVEATRRAAAEVAGAVKASAEQAEETAEVATKARDAAMAGVDAAEQANEAMRSVRDSSQEVTVAIGGLASKSEQIGAIVQTITGIAEQTNLLALNAAIEAARAGDQGRGFAVVADEVRKLAEESQQAAHEISQLIGAIQQETSKAVGVVEDGAKRTSDGVAVVEQTRQAFVTIGQAVDDMTARIEQIAASAEQITASASSMEEGIGEIEVVAEQSSASTEQVSASTQETSASAEQIAASAHELASNAQQLNRLVGHFQINLDSSGSLSEVLTAARDAQNAWGARLREAIDSGQSSMSTEQAGSDDQCAFGKWLHAPGEFRTSQPERWQQIHDLHDQFHREAAQVLKLATTGQKRQATERMNAPDFVNVCKELVDALRGAITA